MQTFTVTIDGIKVDAAKGATILDAAVKAGIWIPTLCHHPALESRAACRVCMVEIDRGGWTQMVTACNYPVRKDLTVYTASERAISARRGVMELIMARVPQSSAIRELAAKMGMEVTPWPTITESTGDCILCGLCVQVCEEIMGSSAISFAGRGTDRSVATPFRLASDDCTGCGACAAVCPTGAIKTILHQEEGTVEISPFGTRVKLLSCRRCGNPLAGTPVNSRMLANLRIGMDELGKRLALCPSCRRKETAAGMSNTASVL